MADQKGISRIASGGGIGCNRLIFEKSPYLLQHASNPVDWYPWCREAFEKAEGEDKPVFLSIGYTTCHWCHVMEHESFEDVGIARLMNRYFVPVKVDREERPDIDEVYMTVTQAMTGSGGWPMTVIMTPDKKPFFAGTYFPKHDRPGRPGLIRILQTFAKGWRDNRAELLKSGDKVAQFLAHANGVPLGKEVPGKDVMNRAFEGLSQQFDPNNGGFGQRPKFPVPSNLSFLLAHYDRTRDEKALDMVEKTLRAMRMGGIYDQVGYGMHRYATDPEWLVPHFEKMLYDQALLTIAYTEAYQATGDPCLARTAHEILEYVSRDMTSPLGGFYSAEDADSEGVEGKFYVWKTTEVLEALGPDDGMLFNRIFQIKQGGNFADEASGKRTGTNIPHLTEPISQWAAKLGSDEAGLQTRLSEMRRKLFTYRERRVHPQKDDKILTDWNGLMIAAFAKAAKAFESKAYAETASRAADFVLENLRGRDGRLLKRFRQGDAGLTAHLTDYAFLTWGLIELYEATFETRYLREAVALTEHTLEHFWDKNDGGFFFTADDSEQLLVRSKKLYGGAIPSGNAVAALNLGRLYRMTNQSTYEHRCIETLRAFGGRIEEHPAAFPQAMLAVDFLLGPTREIVIVGKPDSTDVKRMAAAVQRPFLPRQVVLFRPVDGGDEISRLAPYTSELVAESGVATAYVCENFACRLPVTQVDDLLDPMSNQS